MSLGFWAVGSFFSGREVRGAGEAHAGSHSWRNGEWRCKSPGPPPPPFSLSHKKNGPWKGWVYYALLNAYSEKNRRQNKNASHPTNSLSSKKKGKRKQTTKVSWVFQILCLFLFFFFGIKITFSSLLLTFSSVFFSGLTLGVIKSLEAIMPKYVLSRSLWKQLCCVQTWDDETENTSKNTRSSSNRGAALCQLSRIKLSQENEIVDKP